MRWFLVKSQHQNYHLSNSRKKICQIAMSRKRFNFPDFIHENVDKRLQNKLKVYLPHLSRTLFVVDHNVFTLGRRHFILSNDEEKGSFRIHWSLTKISCCLCDKTFWEKMKVKAIKFFLKKAFLIRNDVGVSIRAFHFAKESHANQANIVYLRWQMVWRFFIAMTNFIFSIFHTDSYSNINFIFSPLLLLQNICNGILHKLSRK